jgi:hypothetical protein
MCRTHETMARTCNNKEHTWPPTYVPDFLCKDKVLDRHPVAQDFGPLAGQVGANLQVSE